MTLHTDTIPNSHCLVPLGASLGQFIFNLMTFKKKKIMQKLAFYRVKIKKYNQSSFWEKNPYNPYILATLWNGKKCVFFLWQYLWWLKFPTSLNFGPAEFFIWQAIFVFFHPLTRLGYKDVILKKQVKLRTTYFNLSGLGTTVQGTHRTSRGIPALCRKLRIH